MEQGRRPQSHPNSFGRTHGYWKYRTSAGLFRIIPSAEDALVWAFDRVLLSAKRPLELLDQKELAAAVAAASTAFCFSNDRHNVASYDQVRSEIRAEVPKAYLSCQRLRSSRCCRDRPAGCARMLRRHRAIRSLHCLHYLVVARFLFANACAGQRSLCAHHSCSFQRSLLADHGQRPNAMSAASERRGGRASYVQKGPES